MGVRFVTAMIVFLCLLLVPSTSVACNASQMNFISIYSLGKQDEFNRTFTKLQSQIASLPDVIYQVAAGPKYTVSQIRPTFYYRDSKQKVDFKAGNILIVSGGALEVTITFTWNKEDSAQTNGTAQAEALSDELILAKSIVIENNTSYSYDLLSLMPFALPSLPFILSRIDPPVSASDQQVLLMMLNNMADHKDTKNYLETQINKNYSYYVNSSLHDKHFPIDSQFDYHWTPQHKPNVTVPFFRRPTSVDLQKFGFISSFDVQALNASSWSCGSRKVLDMPLDPNIFGGIQEYVSFDFYQNVIGWALEHQVFDSDLNSESWGNRMFQFYAGDLYQVLSGIQNKYYASEPVTGSCKGNRAAGVKVYINNNSSFNATLKFNCGLTIKTEDVVKIDIILNLTIAGMPNVDTLDFQLVSHEQLVTLTPQGQYQVANQELALLMISDCLNRLYEGVLFGSGWPQSPPRAYPHFRVMQNFTIVLDSSHIDKSLSLQFLDS